jgi:carboxyl-terminal processing protease
MNKKYLIWRELLVALLLGILIGFFASSLRFSENGNMNNYLSTLWEKYYRMEEISYILENEYYDESFLSWKNSEMIENATKAFVDWLWDPYTSYLDEEQYSWLQTELVWEDFIEWIGAVVWKKDYYVQVEEIVKGSPAYKAGLQPLDRIVMIWTWETQDLTVTEAVKRIRWPKGTTVDLFIERVDKTWKKEYLHVEIERDVIDIPSVKSKILEKDWVKIGYIEIFSFWNQTNKLFTHAISEILLEKVKWVIIDVRWNGWGLLTSAVQLAWHFIPQWELIVKSKYKKFNDTGYLSEWFWELENMPTVILIDGLSASSSEIFALALKEKQWATIVWKQSFWKWSIQTLFDFEDGTSLKFTVWKRFSPNGISVDDEWIKPDIEESVDITGYVENWIDSQLEKAKEVLLEKIK